MYRRSRQSRQRQATAAALERMALADGMSPTAARQMPQNPAIHSPRAIGNAFETMLTNNNQAGSPITPTTTANHNTDVAAITNTSPGATETTAAGDESIPMANNEIMPPLPTIPPLSPTVNNAHVYDLHDEWTMPRHENYEYFLRPFFQYVHRRDQPYPKGTIFSKGQLLQIQPGHVRDYLAYKAFGKANYDYANGDRPTNCRSSSLENVKKALSYFMPEQVPYINGQGNPTKSKIVSDVIKFVQLCEVRGEGAPSQAKRALTQAEFRKEMELLAAHKDDLTHTVTFRTLGLWQYHLVGRVDDAANAKLDAPKVHSQYSDLLQTAVTWSKNVRDERRCPDQILLGAMDDFYCLFIALAIHLESFLAANPNATYLFTEQEDTTKVDQQTGKTKIIKASTRLKNKYRGVLRRAAWEKPEFLDLSGGLPSKLSTHSKRKLPANYAANCGAHGEEVEIRGRWKGTRGGKIVSRYIDVKQLYQDAKVAGILCIGGPCKYIYKDGCDSITDDWLFEHVVPNIKAKFGRSFAAVLGKALLYICLKEQNPQQRDTYVPVPADIQQRVCSAYAELGLSEAHPVLKVPLHIYRINEMLQIDTMQPGRAAGVAGENVMIALQDTNNTFGNNGLSNEVLQSVVIRMNRLEQMQAQSQQCLLNSLGELQTQQKRQFQVLNNNIRCFGGRIEGSLVRQVNSNRQHRLLPMNQADDACPMEVVNDAQLSSLPRDLITLWREYQFGLNGRKAARLFTTEERNANRKIKQKFYRRDQVWECMKRQIRRGLTPEQAAHELRTVYGNKASVSKIIDVLIKDKKRYKRTGGYHPNLSV